MSLHLKPAFCLFGFVKFILKPIYYVHLQAVETVVPDPTVLDLLVPALKPPVKTEDSIIEVLKYSQKDMNAALQKADRQVSSESHTRCIVLMSNYSR